MTTLAGQTFLEAWAKRIGIPKSESYLRKLGIPPLKRGAFESIESSLRLLHKKQQERELERSSMPLAKP